MSTEGWIEWKGGECPVEMDVLIEARLLKGDQYEGRAGEFMRGRWEHSPYIPERGHIIAYRIVKP